MSDVVKRRNTRRETMIGRGSEWHRWEPHIHAPGTLMNNQFKGPTAWDDYVSALEAAMPVIEAIAVTDYYLTDTYERIRDYKEAGRLPSVGFVFPNVELRLDVATAKGRFVNAHLFVSPEDACHLEELANFLSRLHFDAYGERFACLRAGLIGLGRKADPTVVVDEAALKYGATQFKVSFKDLRDEFKASVWARENIRVGVAGGADDGTSGVRGAAHKTLREEIEKFADVIFAGGPAQREFWLGERDLTADQIRARYRGLKPCLHGSDAHKLEDVATPFGNRYSWIKGGLDFDSLRQACIEPRGRAWVGSRPPASATPSQVVAKVEGIDAPWMRTPVVPLNAGLVAIIGARGSGKTALADLIAAGCDSIPSEAWAAEEWANPSFLVRARPLIGEGKVKVTWGTGDPAIRSLRERGGDDAVSYPRVRYLSQQFVEDLCSAGGMTDELLQEIERVIFEAHPQEERENTLNFAELLDLRATRHRLARQREAEAVSDISERISEELKKQQLVAGLRMQVRQKRESVDRYTADRAKLVAPGSEQRAQRHTEIAGAANVVTQHLRRFTNQRQTFVALQDEVNDFRRNKAPETLRQTQSRHSNSGMSGNQWIAFLLDYTGDVDVDLASYVRWVDGKVAELKGTSPPEGDPDTRLIAKDADLSELPLALLEAEMVRLEKLVSADRETQRKYAAASKVIARETAELGTLETKLEDCEGARARGQVLYRDREKAYGRAFDALQAEQSVLEELYRPLMQRLARATGTLNRLSFSVARVADVEAWANEAEEGLIDLRKQGAFRGRGTLIQVANDVLKDAWETGSSEEVRAAMADFRDRYQEDLLAHSPMAHDDQERFRAWSKLFAQWLFSTGHIGIQYGIAYDGVDIRKLSPGTRGIVLLLLYLALDHADTRPLVIDQPEENLDPKSVFDELVELFIKAKSKRQVIIVTHNANLVVNTDADQVIVAEVGPHPQGGLPPISYKAGGLQNAEIRKAVCDILEGGEEAFRERARRLRVGLPH